MPDIPRKQQELQVSLMGGQTDFSSKEGRNSFEEKKKIGKKRKKKLDLHMQLELHIFACVAGWWFS